jgi:hypothetical protein
VLLLIEGVGLIFLAFRLRNRRAENLASPA